MVDGRASWRTLGLGTGAAICRDIWGVGSHETPKGTRRVHG